LARRINSLGGVLQQITVVHDEAYQIISAIRQAMALGPDIIITTGGLGPTPGDITLDALAEALSIKLHQDELAVDMVKTRLEFLWKNGFIDTPEMSPERSKMAMIPLGSTPLFNPIGVAPGVLTESGRTHVISLPGVPSEMMGIFETYVPILLKQIAFEGVHVEREIYVDEKDESILAAILKLVMNEVQGVNIKSFMQGYGSYLRTTVVLSTNANSINEGEKKIQSAIKSLENRLNYEGQK
jgi:molybdopterin-biosynthesis enzyme MoeA-like protein